MRKNKMFVYTFTLFTSIGLTACGSETKEPVLAPQDQSQIRSLKPGSAQEFEASLKSYLLNRPKTSIYGEGSTGHMSFSGMTAESLQSGSAASPSPSASSTNLIEAGVDESDYVKTDGAYLYIVKGRQYEHYFPENDGVITIGLPVIKNPSPQIEIYQLDPAKADAKLISTITISDTESLSGIYLSTSVTGTKRLVAVAQKHQQIGIYNIQPVTQVFTYDVTDPTKTTLLWNFETEGYSNATRILNNRIYFVTRKSFYLPEFNYWVAYEKMAAANATIVAQLTVDKVLPHSRLNNVDIAVVTASDCAIPTNTDVNSYFDMGVTSVIGLDLDTPQQTQAFCTLESSNNMYVSTKSLYLTKPAYADGVTYTVVHKLALNPTGIEYRASGTVPGAIGWGMAEFKINEFNNFLRIITSELSIDGGMVSEKHTLTVLAESLATPNHLKAVSHLPNTQRPDSIGKPNEQLYGVRFFGDYAYAVTFQRTDPLYVLNLKNPADPFIEGELEIPGYSDYLHPLNDNTLLGIGKDALVSNGITNLQGLKIALFDVTNKTQPRLLNEIILGQRGTHSTVLSDYKAFTILKSKQTESWRLAFPVSVHSGAIDPLEYAPFEYCGLGLYEIKNNTAGTALELSTAGTLKLPTTQTQPFHTCDLHQARSAFVDDAVYFSGLNRLWSTMWQNPTQLTAN